MASGIEIAPTLGSTGSFNWGGLDGSTTVGNPTGLTLGAGAGGGLPKIAMTDKINAGVGVFNSALGAVSAYKALKLGKENLAFQKDSFNRNFEAMKGTTNAQLADRQAARVRNYGTGVYDSVADYMAKYGVK
jgi:NCAIR mutase (PurE)-related protein